MSVALVIDRTPLVSLMVWGPDGRLNMPIETRNGVTAPIPFEEYQYFKIKKLEEKMDKMSKKIDEDLSNIDKKLDKLSSVFASTQKKEPETKELTAQEKAGLLSST